MKPLRFKSKDLPYIILGGDLNFPKDICLSSDFYHGINYRNRGKGDLVLASSQEGSKIYQVKKTDGEEILVLATEYKTEYNQVLRDFRKGLTPEQIKEDGWSDPKGSAINLVQI